MSIETGFEIVDAIVNNPIQAILLFAITYIGFKFFCGCHGFWADMRRDLKFSLKWSIQRPIDRQLVHLLDWLERRDIVYNKWAKTKSQKDWLKYSLTIWSCLFLPLLIWNVFFPEFLSDKDEISYLLVVILSIEYIGIMTVTVYSYEKRKKKEYKNAMSRL